MPLLDIDGALLTGSAVTLTQPHSFNLLPLAPPLAMASSVASPPRQRKADTSRAGAGGATGARRGPRMDKEDPRTIGPWRIGKTIGKGSSGRVKIAKHSKTGKYAAVKIVPKQMLLNSRMSITEAGAKADKMLLGIEREIVIMKLIEHPNVMSLYDVWETSNELWVLSCFRLRLDAQGKGNRYLILEYVEGGELFDYLVSRGRLHEDEALHYFQQIISGVDYCHQFNICHRDLKPENLVRPAPAAALSRILMPVRSCSTATATSRLPTSAWPRSKPPTSCSRRPAALLITLRPRSSPGSTTMARLRTYGRAASSCSLSSPVACPLTTRTSGRCWRKSRSASTRCQTTSRPRPRN